MLDQQQGLENRTLLATKALYTKYGKITTLFPVGFNPMVSRLFSIKSHLVLLLF